MAYKRKRTTRRVTRRRTVKSRGRSRTRATTTKRRRTSVYRGTGIRGGGSSIRRVAVPLEHRDTVMAMLNPFANKSGAKEPDGAVPESHALTHRISEQITLKGQTDAGDAEKATVHLVLIPGLHCGAAAYQLNDGADDEFLGYYKWNTDSFVEGSFQGSDAASTDDTELALSGSINKWRVVAQALRLKMLNTFEKNDGWWQSVRLNYQAKMDHWEVYAPLASAPATVKGSILDSGAYIRPTKKFFQDACIGKNLAEHKSYSCGSLTEIGSKQWNLARYSKDNEFNDIRSKYILPNGAVTTTVPVANQAQIQLNAGFNQNAALYDAVEDQNFDIVYIRIHPGLDTLSLLADAIVHQEVCYDLDSPLAKFMTASAKASTLLLGQVAAAQAAAAQAGSALQQAGVSYVAPPQGRAQAIAQLNADAAAMRSQGTTSDAVRPPVRPRAGGGPSSQVTPSPPVRDPIMTRSRSGARPAHVPTPPVQRRPTNPVARSIDQNTRFRGGQVNDLWAEYASGQDSTGQQKSIRDFADWVNAKFHESGGPPMTKQEKAFVQTRARMFFKTGV